MQFTLKDIQLVCRICGERALNIHRLSFAKHHFFYCTSVKVFEAAERRCLDAVKESVIRIIWLKWHVLNVCSEICALPHEIIIFLMGKAGYGKGKEENGRGEENDATKHKVRQETRVS